MFDTKHIADVSILSIANIQLDRYVNIWNAIIMFGCTNFLRIKMIFVRTFAYIY